MQLPSTKKRNSGFFSSLHLIEGILRQKPYWKDSGDEGSTSEIMIGRETTSVQKEAAPFVQLGTEYKLNSLDWVRAVICQIDYGHMGIKP